MNYTTHELQQGSPEWLVYRQNTLNASDAGTVLGVNPYKTRAELIQEMATGITKEIDAGTQRRFDDGHRFERLALPLAEAIIGEPLSPTIVSCVVPGLRRRLSASLDGATFGDSENVEHKTLNESLAAALDRGELPEQYPPQMEQGMMITGATRCLFIASKWDDNDQLIAEKHVWYESNPVLRTKIIAAWKQAEADANTYEHIEAAPVAVAAPQMQLPAVSIQVNGSIALIDNLAVFGEALTAYVGRINQKPETDQDFADLDATVKTLKTAEEALTAAENGALAQTASIDQMRRQVAQYKEIARVARLQAEKTVKAEKENRRAAIVTAGIKAITDHIAALNTRLGKPYMPSSGGNFAGVVKGLKTMTSIQNAVDSELARCKIEANEIADRIEINLNFLRKNAKEYPFLFADASQIVLKANDDFAAMATLRITEHKAAEAKKEAEQRERIRLEEEAKAQAKIAAENHAKEQAEIAERNRLQGIAEAEAVRLALEAERQREKATAPAIGSTEPAPPASPTAPVSPAGCVEIEQAGAAPDTSMDTVLWKAARWQAARDGILFAIEDMSLEEINLVQNAICTILDARIRRKSS